MLEEKASLQGVRSHSVLELFRNRGVRWQLLTVVVCFTALQLCGINAVSHRHADFTRRLYAPPRLEGRGSRPLAAGRSNTTAPAARSANVCRSVIHLRGKCSTNALKPFQILKSFSPGLLLLFRGVSCSRNPRAPAEVRGLGNGTVRDLDFGSVCKWCFLGALDVTPSPQDVTFGQI